jgi:large subunit ribosomal protein L22
MPGPKLNEGATVVGERAGTKARARYVRMSARKARVVLDLIRDLDVRRADEVLQFTDRAAAREVRKVLASAVANAVHNDEQDPDELFVIACFADEGPTLRRFRPRARGRATRIRKRTCHITVIVARMSPERLALMQARAEAGSVRPASSSRRARVERSRQRAAAAAETIDQIDAEEAGQDAQDADVESETDTAAAGTYEASAEPLEDGSAPEGFAVKGNEDSKLFHEPGSRYYDITNADVYFESAEAAEAAGFSRAGEASAASDAADDTASDADTAEDSADDTAGEDA